MSSSIRILNARTHNLKGVDLEIPHQQLTVITGVSGSGKSSLAMDTLYAEGQRQYIESLSTYARQFLHQLQKPDVELIEGLQPTLCIDQQSATANPRSTVATVTEIYDYLRLLMARVGTPHCYSCGKPIVQQSPQQIQDSLRQLPERTKVVLMAPVVRGRRGAHRDELEKIRKAGLVRVRIDNELYDIDETPTLAVRKNHSIDAVVDKIVIRQGCESRLAESIRVALELAGGLVAISFLTPERAEGNAPNHWEERLFSVLYACPDCGVSYEELEPRTFSFNSPYGACPKCDGVGHQLQFDPTLLQPDWSKAPKSGGLSWLDDLPVSLRRKLRTAIKRDLKKQNVDWDKTLEKLTKSQRQKLMHGTSKSSGLLAIVQGFYDDCTEDEQAEFEQWQEHLPCPDCGGGRLRKEALAVYLDGRNIREICEQDIASTLTWFEGLSFPAEQRPIAKPIVTEMLHRFYFLDQVGVGYLSLSRSAHSLSGGELQRVRLATSIGSGLVGVAYILDEPSIGLHQRDNDRLIESLRDLQQQGNTVIVVEHDEAMMRAADMLVDVGPGAGKQGGEIVAAGTPLEVEACPESLTAAFLRGDERVERNTETRSPSKEKWIKLSGAGLHNLQKVDLEVPVGLLIGVTGVSGSGKSSLFSETLVPALKRAIGQSKARGGPFDRLEGEQWIDKLIEIDQAPIGRTPRSTPATYCGVFDLIRKVWANTRDAKRRGFTASRFSFNAGAGRCSQCQGQGQEKIEMNFLPDLYVTCSACGGLRYNRQTLQIRFREKNIADILAMSVDEACDFFENFSKIYSLLKSLQVVGLGYVSLGQSSSTLSGGEAQRIKLASELAKRETGSTLYFLDEPTTGLHFADVRRLIHVLDGLVERGNTVVVIEHNLDVIRSCDWLIDIGPGGGADGGRIVATGPVSKVAKVKGSLTAKFL